MRPVVLAALIAAAAVLAAAGVGAHGDDDDDAKPSAGKATAPQSGTAGAGQPPGVVSLTREQEDAIGIVVARPPAVKLPERIAALGVVLDPEPLIAELGEMSAAAGAEHANLAEVERLIALHAGGADASLKMIEAAQAEESKSVAQSRLAAARFALEWAPLAAMPAARRQALVAAAADGRGLFVRADLLGRQSISDLPRRALLGVDGVQVAGRVLGVLRQTSEAQSVGLLIAVDAAPAGLSPGARIPVSLLSPPRSGRLVRRDAVFYDEKGAYVYERLQGKTGNEINYRPSRVKLLFAADGGWLVDGIDDDDLIVMRGAGALWSLQEMHGAVDDDDDDD